MSSMVGMDQGPPPGVRREETEPKKADSRRKRETDQTSGRGMEHPRNKEPSSSVNGVSSIKPKPADSRPDRFEKSPDAARCGPVRERQPSTGLSPPRAWKRKFSSRDAKPSATEAERKQQSSVVSCIHLSSVGEKRNGMKERPASRKAEVLEGSGRGNRGFDGASNEDDYRLKRRPASASSRGRDDEEHRHRRPASKRRGEK